jgi:hypothetical protein
MGLDKSSSLVTTLSNRPSLLRGGLLEGEWGSPGWRPGRMIAGSQDFIPGAETRFWLSRDFMDGCQTWDLRGHAYDMSVRFFPCRVYIDLNCHDTLEYKWSLACCCHLIVCLIVLMVWIRGWWMWLWLSWGLLYYFNNVNYLDDACFMHVIIYRCKPNLWLN